jgi:hypothetical protein
VIATSPGLHAGRYLHGPVEVPSFRGFVQSTEAPPARRGAHTRGRRPAGVACRAYPAPGLNRARSSHRRARARLRALDAGWSRRRPRRPRCAMRGLVDGVAVPAGLRVRARPGRAAVGWARGVA